MLMTILFIGTTELLLIGGIALLLFGGKKLPEMMRGMGRGVKSFHEGMNEGTNPAQQPNGENQEAQPTNPAASAPAGDGSAGVPPAQPAEEQQTRKAE